MASQEDRTKVWKDRWNEGQTGFHKTDVHQLLINHFDKICSKGKEKMFVPLCGKSVDMKWLSDKGITVVGLDAARVSLEQFFSEHSLKYTASPVPALGGDAEVLKSEDNSISLYCADLFKFNKDTEGTFDAVWDRGSLVALDREDVPMYVSIMKTLLKPGGICLHEAFEYNLSDFEGLDITPKIPPPHPMPENQLRQLFEPDCTVERLEENSRPLASKECKTVGYLITKK